MYKQVLHITYLHYVFVFRIYHKHNLSQWASWTLLFESFHTTKHLWGH